MTDSHVTQCPHCQTRFRVSAAQLGMAYGAVRCGACLKVFNAAEQLGLPVQPFVPPAADDELDRLAAGTQAAGLTSLSTRPHAAPNSPTLQASTATAPLERTPGPAPTPTTATTATTAASATAELPAWALEPSPASETATAPSGRPEQLPPPGSSIPATARHESLWMNDDLDLDSLDLDEELAKLEPDSFEIEQELRQRQPVRMPERSPLDEPREPHDESWADALLLDQSPSPAAARRNIEPELSLDSLDNLDDELADAEDDAREAARLRQLDSRSGSSLGSSLDNPVESPPDSPRATVTPLAASREGRPRESRLRAESLRDLQDEPLQLQQAPANGAGRSLFWALLVLLALAALLGQYVQANFDALARQAQWRPWLEQACPLFGCQLPPQVDVGQIRSSNLVVRSHPRHPGALSVDAILYNRADFAQPFPLLELRFEDLNGRVLASRRFKPAEYLAGEVDASQPMPPQTPIHIALEILDPGAQAVNYSLEFHSPD